MTDPDQTDGALRTPNAFDVALDGLGRVNRAIGLAGRTLAGALLGIMTVAVLTQVVARYGLNNSLSWTEEVSKTLMVWTAFLVAPWAYRERANVSIDLFTEALPPGVLRGVQIVITLLVLWILAILFVESLDFVARGMKSRAATIPAPTGLFYVIAPISFAALIAVGVENLARLSFGRPPTGPS
ncbi:MAG: TRAP transporter small permease [Pseudomonadota bacterium]